MGICLPTARRRPIQPFHRRCIGNWRAFWWAPGPEQVLAQPTGIAYKGDPGES
jgi:hypothetical protein